MTLRLYANAMRVKLLVAAVITYVLRWNLWMRGQQDEEAIGARRSEEV